MASGGGLPWGYRCQGGTVVAMGRATVRAALTSVSIAGLDGGCFGVVVVFVVVVIVVIVV